MIIKNQQSYVHASLASVTLITDLHGLIKDITGDEGKTFGLSPQQLVGQLISDSLELVKTGSGAPINFSSCLNTVALGETCTFCHSDGNRIPVTLSVIPYRRYGQAPINIIAIQEAAVNDNPVAKLQEKIVNLEKRLSNEGTSNWVLNNKKGLVAVNQSSCSSMETKPKAFTLPVDEWMDNIYQNSKN